jgi:hypothetical protein
MAEKSKEPSPQKQLDETLHASKSFEAQRTDAPPVELAGRIRKLEQLPDKFMLLVPSSTAGADHALEINASDVIEHKLVFEDSSGEKTHSVSLAPSSQVKLTVPAASFQRPAKFDPKQFDPKQIDPKQLEPKQFDPKQIDPKQLEPKQFDPKQIDPKQLEPKHFDPKHLEPKSFEPKQFEPKGFEPKGFEPKGFEPKGDPGPIGPFVLMTPWQY